MASLYSEATLSAGSPASDWVLISGSFDFSIQGTFTGSVTVQRKRTETGDAEDVRSFTEEIASRSCEPTSNTYYRFNFDTPTSGTPAVKFWRG